MSFDLGWGVTDAAFSSLSFSATDPAEAVQNYDGKIERTWKLGNTAVGDRSRVDGWLRARAVRTFAALSSDVDEKVFFFKVKPLEAPLNTDVMLWGGQQPASMQHLDGRYRAGISRTQYMALLESYMMCLDNAEQFRTTETCEAIQFTRSVWRGSAPVGQVPGWECISDLDDYTTTLPWLPPPYPPSPPPDLSLSLPPPPSPCPPEPSPPPTRRQLDEGSLSPMRTSDEMDKFDKFGAPSLDSPPLDTPPTIKAIPEAERRSLDEDDAWLDAAFEAAVRDHKHRQLRHGCANSRSGCRVLPPPRR